MKICYDQGCNDIGVVIATKWRYYLFYLQQYISALGTVPPNCSRELFPPIAASVFVKFKRNKSVRALSRYCGMKFFMVRNSNKWTILISCLAVICRKQSAFHMQFHLLVVSIFLKRCVKDHGDSSNGLLERRIWLVFIEALLLAVL